MSDFEKNAISVSREVAAAPNDVWDVLSDGWLYPCWVVGAARMRDVDPSWPEKGSRLHHSVGNWPLLLDDKSEVLDSLPLRSLRLRAHGWPAGAAEVLIEIEEQGRRLPGDHPRGRGRGSGSVGPTPRATGLHRAPQPGNVASAGLPLGRTQGLTDAQPSPGRSSRRAHVVLSSRRRTMPEPPSAERAAFHPHAPCTPPPGCAEAPAR